MGIVENRTEIFKNITRLMIAPNQHFEFNQFLIKDNKNCLIHTGKSSLFEPLKKSVIDLLNGEQIDYIVFSHFEADECGSVNKWLQDFPQAQVVCNKVANINLGDFLIRPAKIIKDNETIALGDRTLRLIETPHFPHNWDAHMWYEESEGILFSSDFCCHGGISTPIIEKDNAELIIDFYEKGKFIPYGKTTNQNLNKINSIGLKHLAPMHGSIIKGKAAKVVLEKVSADLRSKGLE